MFYDIGHNNYYLSENNKSLIYVIVSIVSDWQSNIDYYWTIPEVSYY